MWSVGYTYLHGFLCTYRKMQPYNFTTNRIAAQVGACLNLAANFVPIDPFSREYASDSLSAGYLSMALGFDPGPWRYRGA